MENINVLEEINIALLSNKYGIDVSTKLFHIDLVMLFSGRMKGQSMLLTETKDEAEQIIRLWKLGMMYNERSESKD